MAGVDLPWIDFTDTPLPRGPWIRGRVTADVEEHPTPEPGLSVYKLAGGDIAVLLEATDALPSGLLAAIVLWRVVANATRVCPCCAARGQLSAGGSGSAVVTLEHEAICCLSDAALKANWQALSKSPPLPDGLPAKPRLWQVRPPRLAINQKSRRRQ